MVTSLEYALWLDFGLFAIMLALLAYVFANSAITLLHKVYLAFHACLMLWPLCQFAMTTTDEPFYQLFYLKGAYCGLSVLGFGWTVFTIFLTGQSYYLNRRTLTALAAPTIVIVACILLNPGELFVRPVDGMYTERTYGALFWVMVTVLIGYVMLSGIVMLRTIRGQAAPRHKRQIMMALTGMCILTSFALLDITLNVWLADQLPLIPGMMSAGIMFSTFYFVVAIKKYRVFDVVRLAQVNVVDSMSTGIAVLDEHDVVLETNRVFRSLFDIRTGDRLQIEPFLEPLESEGGLDAFLAAYRSSPPEPASIEVAFKDRDRFRHVVVHGEPIIVQSVWVGRVLTFQDVSEFRQLVDSSYRQNEALQQRNRELVEMQEELYELNQRLERMAITDSLTGCYNRRYLMQQLEHEVMTNVRYNIPFAIFLFDIDLFKSINDTYGHLVGDEVIKGTAEAVRNSLRRTDILARYGGEEFTVYLPHTSREQAAMLAERVRRAISSNAVPCGDGRTVSVTVSMGVLAVEGGDGARIDNSKEYLRELFAKADGALYQAKNGGRNRIVITDWQS